MEINNAYNEGRLQVATDPTLGLQKMKAACLQASLDSAKWRGYYTLLHQHLTYEVLLQQTDTALLKAAFSADGRTFSTTAGDGVRIYHTGETQPFQRLFLANNTVHELYFQGNDTLWSGAQDRITYAWAQGRPLPFFEPIGGDLEYLGHPSDPRFQRRTVVVYGAPRCLPDAVECGQPTRSCGRFLPQRPARPWLFRPTATLC